MDTQATFILFLNISKRKLKKNEYTISFGTGKKWPLRHLSSSLYLKRKIRYFRHNTQLNYIKINWTQNLLNPTNAGSID